MTEIVAAGPYEDFVANPAIAALAPKKRWTVTAVNKHKMPVDFKNLMDTGRVFGAQFSDERCLLSLEEVNDFLPNVTNNAFYLEAATDRCMIIDIESHCPPEVAAELLDTMPAHYAEVSLSGAGYHLVVPMPQNWGDFPNAQRKTVLKEEHAWYEILMDHWVTFTRRQTPTLREPDDPYALRAWNELYARLAENAAATTVHTSEIEAEKPHIPREDVILRALSRVSVHKTLADFNNDHSRFEFSVMGTLYAQLKRLMSLLASVYPDLEDTTEIRAWLLYEAAREHLTPREKHEETRSGLPYLLYTAVTLIDRDEATGDA